MTLCIHQTTSKFGGYRKMLEGFAKAGVKNAELTDFVLDEFLKTESLGAAKAVLSDLGITAVSAAAVMQDLWLPGPERVASVEMWKKRCDQFAAIGLKKIYCPSVTVRAVTAEDYKATPACIHEAGEIAMGRGLMAMVEFSRVSTHMSTLGTTIKMIRAAGHANVRLLFDFYHFMSGLSRTEDLDTIRAGEIGHVHFQDLPDIPRELLDANTRAIPGDGVGPLVKILRTLVQKGYAGPLSVELFLPVYQNGDPYLIAKEIREKSERVMRAAKVM
jgi:4-hydroxyphenylpyruvate dioxygenase